MKRRFLKFFSSFPAGLSGAALFLLRAAVGISAIVYGSFNQADGIDSAIWNQVIGIFSIICGAMILIGFLTPLFSALICLGGIAVLISKNSAVYNWREYNFSALYVCDGDCARITRRGRVFA